MKSKSNSKFRASDHQAVKFKKINMFPKSIVIGSLVCTVVAGSILIKDHMGGLRYKGQERLVGRTIIITGANTGIGKETAMDLARRGARVIMACRDMEKCDTACKEIIQETLNKKVVCRKLDLGSFASIREFAKDIKSKESHIDILINNAGVMMCPKSLTEDGLEVQMGTNHFGHFLLTNLLLDRIKESASEKQPGRIIFLSSVAHERGEIKFEDLNSDVDYNARDTYSMSKLANTVCANEMAKRLEGSNVTVNSVHPGLVRTELARHIFSDSWISKISQFVLWPFVFLLLKNPVQGAQTTIKLACDESMKTTTGKYFSDCVEKEQNPRALDDAVGKRLWAVSEVWTKMKKLD